MYSALLSDEQIINKKQSSNTEMNWQINFVAKFVPNFRTWKHNWQVRNKLGNRTLKSDLKSTIILLQRNYSMQVLQANKNLATKWNSGSKSGIKWYIIQEENPCLLIFGTTISTIQTEYCDHICDHLLFRQAF